MNEINWSQKYVFVDASAWNSIFSSFLANYAKKSHLFYNLSLNINYKIRLQLVKLEYYP